MEATQSDIDMNDLNANLSINVKPEAETPIDPPRRSGPSGGIAPKDSRRLGNEMGNYTPSSETSNLFCSRWRVIKRCIRF